VIKQLIAVSLLMMMLATNGYSYNVVPAVKSVDPPKQELKTPPLPKVSTTSEDIPVYQSSYCWDRLGCADSIGGQAQLRGNAPTVVEPGTHIRITWDYEPNPTRMNVNLEDDSQGKPTTIALENGSFQAAEEAGEYYYTISADWLTEDRQFVTNQTSVVIGIKVK